MRPAGLEEDLAAPRLHGQRDRAGPRRTGELREAPGAQDDLRAGLLRVLHDRSFLDDPTRLWRLARYRARLGFEVEPSTRELAREAVAAGALATVSGTRIGNELRLALAEPDPVAALESAAELGPRAVAGAWTARRSSGRSACLGDAGDPRAHRAGDRRSATCPTLGLTARLDARTLDAAAALRAVDLAGAPPSVARPRLRQRPGRGGRGDRARPEARRWLAQDRHRRLAITGEDLIAAGVPRGPELGAPPAGGPGRACSTAAWATTPRTSSPSPWAD